VRVSTRDGEGTTVSRILTLNVLPARLNPYPLIVSSGVNSNQFVTALGQRICGDPAVASGNTIDLRDKGCVVLVGATSPRYSGVVEVENPSGETLTYDWRFYSTDSLGNESVGSSRLGSNATRFELSSPGNASLATRTCRVTLKVNASEASRSKGPLTVWSGKCTALY
jgi:hypothetical protein